MRVTDPVKRLLSRPFDADWRWPSRTDPDEWTRVSFESASATLAGIYADADGPRRGAVLLSHPMDARAKGFFLSRGLADLLREAGYEVFAFDYNGFGESQHGTARFPRDVAAAMSCMDQTVESDQYAAIGGSFGAGILLCGLAQADHDVRVAVFDSMYTEPVAFWKRWNARSALVVGLWLGVRRRTANALTPLANAGNLTTPDAVRFAVGTDDEYTPPRMTHQVADAVGVPDARVETWTVPDAGHLDCLGGGPERCEERLVELLDEVLAEG